jgi:hypothetical protein
MTYAAVSVPAVGDQVRASWGAGVAADLTGGPNMGTPTATAATGTPTSDDTETRDAVLGNYAFTSVAGRRYEVRLNGLILTTSVAGDLVGVRVRNGGAATPTSASTLVASSQVPITIAGGPGAITPPHVGGSFAPGAGVQTLSVFTVRLAGTGAETPVGLRELYCLDIGPA